MSWGLGAMLWIVHALHFALDTSLVRGSHLWAPGFAMWLRASGQIESYSTPELRIHKHRRSQVHSHNLCKKQSSVCPFMQTRHVFEAFSAILPPSNSPSPLRTCQVWLSSMSRMNRQRPISLPSFFLTTPRNHLLAIFLTSLMTDRLLSAFPVPVRFPIYPSFIPPFTLSFGSRVPCVFTVQKVVPVEGRVQETWAQRVALGFIQLLSPVS